MPIRADDQQRIDLLRAELLDIGLEWEWDYRLVDPGPEWRVDFKRAVTDEQFIRTCELVETIMNS